MCWEGAFRSPLLALPPEEEAPNLLPPQGPADASEGQVQERARLCQRQDLQTCTQLCGASKPVPLPTKPSVSDRTLPHLVPTYFKVIHRTPLPRKAVCIPTRASS